MKLQTATLAHFKRSHNHWTAILSDSESRVKVCLPLTHLKIVEGDTLRDIRPTESRPKPERQKTVVLQLKEMAPEPEVLAWALAPQ